MRMLIDMDGVIADFERGFLIQWRLRHPDKPFIPIEERNTHFILDQYPSEYKNLIWQVFLAPGFLRSLPPISGGLEALKEMAAADIEILICTSPFTQYQNCVLEKYEWVDEHLGGDWTKRIILTPDKTLVKADFLIDDMPVVKGMDTPTWKHIIYGHPKNMWEHTRKRLDWDNWKDVMLSEESFRIAFHG